jgi:CheY-like chemotaxis protein
LVLAAALDEPFADRRAALACGCDDFVAKPFDLDSIEQVVRRWLA